MKSSIVCLALAAGASAQFPVATPYYARPAVGGFGNPYGVRTIGGNPYGVRTIGGNPYFGGVRRPTVPATEEQKAAAVAKREADYAALVADWTKTQATKKATDADATKAAIEATVAYDEFVAKHSTNVDTKNRYAQRATQGKFEISNTDAQYAHEAFLANPSRTTSLTSEAANALSSLALMGVYRGRDPEDEEFGKAGRYNAQAISAEMEMAEDSLKAAESGLAFNDDAGAYIAALKSYDSADKDVWEQTLAMQGKSRAGDELSKSRYFDKIQAANAKYSAHPSEAAYPALLAAESTFMDKYFDDTVANYPGKYYDAMKARGDANEVQTAADAILPAFIERNREFGVANMGAAQFGQLANALTATGGR